MRSNAARIDPDMDDMHAFDPQPAPRPGRARRPNTPPAVRSTRRPLALKVFFVIVRRPGKTLLILAGGALVSSIIVNALFLQTGRHPAPLFATPSSSKPSLPISLSPPSGQARTATQTPASEPFFIGDVSPPAPEPASAPRRTPPQTQAPQTQAPQAQAQQAQVSVPKAAPAPKPANESVDAIGALLRGGPPVAAAQTAAINDPVQAKRIVAAQRALEKLGFQVSVDGLNGPGTRTAIQNFERERDLPVTGELNPRTLRVLAARSGVSIP